MHAVKARILPRNIIDALITLVVATLQVIVLLAAPSALVAALWGTSDAGFFTFLILYIIFLLFTVREIRISDAGIQFVRVLGSPKFVPWEKVETVVPVTPKELILKGWLWPIFPPRELTPSLTSSGHYRISFEQKYVYYPPKNREGFEALIPHEIALRSNN